MPLSWEAPKDQPTLGDIIKAELKREGWTQYDLEEQIEAYQRKRNIPESERVHYNQGQISALIRGEVKSPRDDVMWTLNAVFGLDPGTLESRALKPGAARRMERSVPPGAIVISVQDEPRHRVAARLLRLSPERCRMLEEQSDNWEQAEPVSQGSTQHVPKVAELLSNLQQVQQRLQQIEEQLESL